MLPQFRLCVRFTRIQIRIMEKESEEIEHFTRIGYYPKLGEMNDELLLLPLLKLDDVLLYSLTIQSSVKNK